MACSNSGTPVQINESWRLSKKCADAMCDVVYRQSISAISVSANSVYDADCVVDDVEESVEVGGVAQVIVGNGLKPPFGICEDRVRYSPLVRMPLGARQPVAKRRVSDRLAQ